jgi:hypothetical protein
MGSRVATVLRDPVTLLVGGLAVHRLTRLVTEDVITRRPRWAVQQWAEGTAQRSAHPQIGYLVTCPWCVSIWVAAGWAVFAVAAPTVAAPVGAALAWSSLTGLLASSE